MANVVPARIIGIALLILMLSAAGLALSQILRADGVSMDVSWLALVDRLAPPDPRLGPREVDLIPVPGDSVQIGDDAGPPGEGPAFHYQARSSWTARRSPWRSSRPS